MANLADDHLEFEKICWTATMERDPNELVELSLRMCELMDRRQRREADANASDFDATLLPASDERQVEC